MPCLKEIVPKHSLLADYIKMINKSSLFDIAGNNPEGPAVVFSQCAQEGLEFNEHNVVEHARPKCICT